MYRGTPSRRPPPAYRRETYSPGNDRYGNRFSSNGATANRYRPANFSSAGRWRRNGNSGWAARTDQQQTHPQATPAEPAQTGGGHTGFPSPRNTANMFGNTFEVNPEPAPSLILRLEEDEVSSSAPDMKQVRAECVL